MTPDRDPVLEVQATGFRALNDRRDSDMTRTYVLVMVLETAIIIALWIFGRIYS